MSACQIQRGLFMLRDCGNPAVETCQNCGKGLCQEHVAYSDLKPYCIPCQEKLAQEPVDKEKNPSDPNESPDSGANLPPAREWNCPGYSQRWRERYYSNTGFIPYYTTWDQTHYNDLDRGGFASRADSDFEQDDADGEGFSDS
jgi:hypothetical protein